MFMIHDTALKLSVTYEKTQVTALYHRIEHSLTIHAGDVTLRYQVEPSTMLLDTIHLLVVDTLLMYRQIIPRTFYLYALSLSNLTYSFYKYDNPHLKKIHIQKEDTYYLALAVGRFSVHFNQNSYQFYFENRLMTEPFHLAPQFFEAEKKVVLLKWLTALMARADLTETEQAFYEEAAASFHPSTLQLSTKHLLN